MVEISKRGRKVDSEHGITVLISRQGFKGSRVLTIKGMSIDQVYQHITFYFKALEKEKATIEIKEEI